MNESDQKLVRDAVFQEGFLFFLGLGVCRILSRSVAWAKAEYIRVRQFQVRSIEGTQKVDLKTWRLRIEGLVEKPVSLGFDEIKALPVKRQTRNFICVEGWGLDDQNWEGVHLRDLFSKVKISPKAAFVTFHATGGHYKDSLTLQEASNPIPCSPIESTGTTWPRKTDFPPFNHPEDVCLQGNEMGGKNRLHGKAGGRVLGAVRLPCGRFHSGIERLKESPEPPQGQVEGAQAMGRLCQAVVRALDDMHLLGFLQAMKDLRGLIKGDKLVPVSVDDHAVRDPGQYRTESVPEEVLEKRLCREG